MLKYNNYFLFERNIAFFFNYVMQKIIKLMHAGELRISKELYYHQLVFISKNQNIHLQRLFD
jgi:serine/threonine-protein kinase ULK/ATG1